MENPGLQAIEITRLQPWVESRLINELDSKASFRAGLISKDDEARIPTDSRNMTAQASPFTDAGRKKEVYATTSRGVRGSPRAGARRDHITPQLDRVPPTGLIRKGTRNQPSLSNKYPPQTRLGRRVVRSHPNGPRPSPNRTAPGRFPNDPGGRCRLPTFRAIASAG